MGTFKKSTFSILFERVRFGSFTLAQFFSSSLHHSPKYIIHHTHHHQ